MPFILAFSSGPDSVYLLHQLLQKGEKPILAHLNHQLRGAASDDDEQFAREIAQKNGLLCEVKRIDVQAWAKAHKKSLEEAGRILRYHFLEEVRQKHKAHWILTAHHLNDNLETVLMNQKRGCGLRGLIGMQRKQGHLIRPLLNTPKSKILHFLHRHQIPYRIDETNTDTRYLRNRIRHHLIPELLKKNPHLLQEFQHNRKITLKEYRQEQKEARSWLRSQKAYRRNEYKFATPTFSTLSTQKQLQLLQTLYENLYGSTHELKSSLLEETRQLILNNKTSTQKRFGKMFVAKVHHGNVHFERTTHATHSQTQVPPQAQSNSPIQPDASSRHLTSSTSLHPTFTLKILTKLPHSLASETLYFDATNLNPEEIQIRQWKPGDRFQPSGMKGKKKLHDFFIDAKIEKHQRTKIPIFIDQHDEIIAVGNRIDERFKASPTSKKVIQVKTHFHLLKNK